MLTGDELQRGLSAAWRLFLGDRDAVRRFDASFRGFWRSFQAIVLVLPIYVLYVGAERRMILSGMPEGAGIDESVFALSRLVALALDWIAFPLVAALIARPLGFENAYTRLIVAFNWGGPIVATLVALPAVLFAFGIVPGFGASALLLVALFMVVRYRFITARAATGASIPIASGLVALEFLLSLVLGEIIGRIAGI